MKCISIHLIGLCVSTVKLVASGTSEVTSDGLIGIIVFVCAGICLAGGLATGIMTECVWHSTVSQWHSFSHREVFGGWSFLVRPLHHTHRKTFSPRPPSQTSFHHPAPRLERRGARFVQVWLRVTADYRLAYLVKSPHSWCCGRSVCLIAVTVWSLERSPYRRKRLSGSLVVTCCRRVCARQTLDDVHFLKVFTCVSSTRSWGAWQLAENCTKRSHWCHRDNLGRSRVWR